jgi:hypothetical protein
MLVCTWGFHCDISIHAYNVPRFDFDLHSKTEKGTYSLALK